VVIVSALYVDPKGIYSEVPDVECWPEERDARLYAGPWPVVAHPPCSRWCRLAGLVEARWGHRRGDDGGCFAAALDAVRRWGGVLEHPAYTDAWRAYDLLPPFNSGGWSVAGDGIGWVCHVEQGRYGHRAKKATWLYSARCDLPSLRWGHRCADRSDALVSWCGNRTFAFSDRRRIGKKAASTTPAEFRDVLLSIARTRRAAALVRR
jgi:hypothetical protein